MGSLLALGMGALLTTPIRIITISMDDSFPSFMTQTQTLCSHPAQSAVFFYSIERNNAPLILTILDDHPICESHCQANSSLRIEYLGPAKSVLTSILPIRTTATPARWSLSWRPRIKRFFNPSLDP